MVRRAQRIGLVLAGLVALGGALALLGWLSGSDWLKSGIVGSVPMNPATALLFAFVAIVLALKSDPRGVWSSSRTAFLLAIFVTGVGAAILGRYVTTWELPIDRVLFRNQLGENRMAPNTALYFMLTGLSLLTLDSRREALRVLSHAAMIVVAIGSTMSLVGYGYGTRNLYGIGSYIPMALNTACLFLITSIALLTARLEQGVLVVLIRKGAGGIMARRLLPAAIVIPISLGFLRMLGQRAGLYDTEFGASLMVVVTVTLLAAAILFTASSLERAEELRCQAEATVRLYADIVRYIPVGLNIWRLENPDDPKSLRFVNTNPAAAALLGTQTELLLGRRISEAFPAVAESDLKTYADTALSGQCHEISERLYGDERVAANYWSIKAFPLPDQCVGLAFENVTARRQAQEQVRKLNQELEQRVQERTAELADANRDLVQKNRENEIFVYSVSHDLRSPLVSLQGFSKELGVTAQELRALLDTEGIPEQIRTRTRVLLDSDVQQSLKFIQSGVLRLSGIIDALLRLSRLGRIEYEFRSLDTSGIVQRVVEAMSGELFEKGVNVQFDDLPSCYGDATAVEQLFANLIGNALKYLSPERRGEISVGAIPSLPTNIGTDPSITYFVRDNGLGIPSSAHDKIFQAFQRVHPKHAPGEGMGLAIVRRIVERHGGRAWVESIEGQGSTFFITLPRPPTTEMKLGAGELVLTGETHGRRTDGHLVSGR